MAKKQNEEGDPTPAAEPLPPDATVSVTLDKHYVHNGKFYAPGTHEVPVDVARDLDAAKARARKVDDDLKAQADVIDTRQKNKERMDKIMSGEIALPGEKSDA